MNTTDSYETYWWLAPKYFKQLSSRPKYLVAIESSIMLIITITAFCGNSLVCLTLVRNPRLRTATNLLILTLAATDMLTACLPLTVATVVLIKGNWVVKVNPLDVQNFPCQFQGVVSPAFTSVSLHIMAMTSINRYLCVANWNLYKNVFTKRRTRLLIIADYVLVMALVSISYPAGFARITLDPRRAMCFTTFKTAQLCTNYCVNFHCYEHWTSDGCDNLLLLQGLHGSSKQFFSHFRAVFAYSKSRTPKLYNLANQRSKTDKNSILSIYWIPYLLDTICSMRLLELQYVKSPLSSPRRVGSHLFLLFKLRHQSVYIWSGE